MDESVDHAQSGECSTPTNKLSNTPSHEFEENGTVPETSTPVLPLEIEGNGTEGEGHNTPVQPSDPETEKAPPEDLLAAAVSASEVESATPESASSEDVKAVAENEKNATVPSPAPLSTQDHSWEPQEIVLAEAHSPHDAYERLDGVRYQLEGLPVEGSIETMLDDAPIKSPQAASQSSLPQYEPLRRSALRGPRQSTSRSPASSFGYADPLKLSYENRIAYLQEELQEVQALRARLETHRRHVVHKLAGSADDRGKKSQKQRCTSVPALYQGTPFACAASVTSSLVRSGSSDFLARCPPQSSTLRQKRTSKSERIVVREEDSAALLGGYLLCDVSRVYTFTKEKRFIPMILDGSDLFIDCTKIQGEKVSTPGPGAYTPRYSNLSH